MQVTVNGKPFIYDETQLQLLDLITLHQVTQPDMVSIQLNNAFVRRDDFSKTLINDSDEIDFLYFMGGGNL